jgi:branched-chain amino acid transport system permease protein
MRDGANISDPATRTPIRPLWRTYAPWIGAALLLLTLPLIVRSGGALTLMSLMGIQIIFALSYNLLLGQTGLLSFGHAVYYGIGAYYAVHTMNWVIKSGAPIPLPAMPLIGGLAGLVLAFIFGWVSTRRAGTVFSMISLGLAELVASSSLILRSFFGGEEGVTTNRTKLLSIFDISFGPQLHVYYLIAAWSLIAAAAMYALTRTPLGRMCNAVRDNPDRAAFVGYDPQMVRYIAFCISGLFAGIAGSLAAINFEIANAAYFGASQSGTVLLATFVGGIGHFFGPILGAILITALQVSLSDITEVWQLYFGLLFITIVMYAPGGLAGIIMRHAPLWRGGTLGQIIPAYAKTLATGLLAASGVILIIELAHRLAAKSGDGLAMKIGALTLDASRPISWLVALALVAAGVWLMRLTLPAARDAFDRAIANAQKTPPQRGGVRGGEKHHA